MILNNAEWDTKSIFLFLGKSLKNDLIFSEMLDSDSREEQSFNRSGFLILPSKLPKDLSFKRLSIRRGKFNLLAIIVEVWTALFNSLQYILSIFNDFMKLLEL